MTFEDRIREMLSNHGLFEDETAAIVKMMKADKTNEPMSGRWNDNVEDYSQASLVLLWYSAGRAALEYIDANCLQVWSRSRFVGQEELNDDIQRNSTGNPRS